MKLRFSTSNLIEMMIMLIGVWALSPTIKNSINQLYPVALAIFCLILMILYGKSQLNKVSTLIILLMLFIVLYKVLGISNETWATHSNPFLFLYTMYCTVFMYTYFEERQIRRVGLILAIVTIINIGYQFFLYYTLGSGSLYHVRNLLDQGIVAGGTSFVAVVMFTGMLCTTLSFLNISKKNKIICIAILVISFFYIINIQTRATALIVLTLFIVACFALGVNRKASPTGIVIFVLVCIAAFVLTPIIINAVANSGNEYFARKFAAISTFMSGGMSISENTVGESSLTTRLYVAGVSLKTWVSSISTFFFGKGYDAGYYYTTGIGRHSELIDMLPKYGLIGLLLIISTFANYFRSISTWTKYRRPYYFLMIGFVIYSILNGVLLSDVGYVVNIIIPLTLTFIGNEQREEDSEYPVYNKY